MVAQTADQFSTNPVALGDLTAPRLPILTNPTNYSQPTTIDSAAVSGAGQTTQTTGYTPATFAEPTKFNVDQDQTVAGQVRGIIAENGPLQQQTETRSLQQVNSRGLLNSSIAVGAGQSALYDAAIPIAQADAASFNRAAAYNADTSNKIKADEFSAQNASSQFNADSTNRQVSQDVAAKNQLILSNLDRGNRIQLANIEADYRSLIQVSSSASDIYRQTLNAIANAVSDPNTDAAAKSDIINGYTGYLQNSLNLIGSINGVDLTGLLDFGTVATQGV